MKFGPVPVARAQGTILAHSLALEGGRMRKGRFLSGEDIARLARAGVGEVTVAELEAGDVHEDRAADRLAAAAVPLPDAVHLRIGPAGTGRVNIYADATGVIELDESRINACNRIDPMITIATLPNWRQVAAGGMVATVKIISYAVNDAYLARACEALRGAMRLHPVKMVRAQLVQTVVDADDGAKGQIAVKERLNRLGVALGPKIVVPHRVEDLAHALRKTTAEVVLILTGSATSDTHDVAPEAVRAAGGHIDTFGMPVDPGNLLFLGQIGGRPVIGLPGCARSPARNGADWVLERIVCGLSVTRADIAGMGVGGLLKESPARGLPRGDIIPD